MTFFPWGECSESAFLEDKENDVKIFNISHITHKKNVVEMEIAGEGIHYCIQPKKKYGKSVCKGTGSSSYGESYRCDLTHIRIPTIQTWYTSVNNKQHVLPDGGYIWWGDTCPGNSSIYGSQNSQRVLNRH